MTKAVLTGLSEDELDVLVSVAIQRAEILDEADSPAAPDAWHEVMLYEEQLAAITSPAAVAGGVARVGAVRAALSAGRRAEAVRLSAQYLREASLPQGRQLAFQTAFDEDDERRASRFPILAKIGLLRELDAWRAAMSKQTRVFPQSA